MKLNWPVIHTEQFFELKLLHFKGLKNNIDDLKIVKANDDSILELLKIWPVNIAKMQERLDSGNSECFISYLKEEPVAYHWIQFSGIHKIRPIGKSINVPLNAFIFYHTRVSKNHQGKGINKIAMSEIISYQKKNEFQMSLIYTSKKNKAQFHSLKSLGFEKVKSITSLKLGSNYYSLSKIWD
ncbi:MAG: GNAT family N-acetyltransferase [Cytophagales bacterium]